jgi:hypothetical protein
MIAANKKNTGKTPTQNVNNTALIVRTVFIAAVCGIYVNRKYTTVYTSTNAAITVKRRKTNAITSLCCVREADAKSYTSYYLLCGARGRGWPRYTLEPVPDAPDTICEITGSRKCSMSNIKTRTCAY